MMSIVFSYAGGFIAGWIARTFYEKAKLKKLNLINKDVTNMFEV